MIFFCVALIFQTFAHFFFVLLFFWVFRCLVALCFFRHFWLLLAGNGGVHEKKLVLLHLDHTLRADERYRFDSQCCCVLDSPFACSASLSADLGGVTFDRYVPHNTWYRAVTARNTYTPLTLNCIGLCLWRLIKLNWRWNTNLLRGSAPTKTSTKSLACFCTKCRDWMSRQRWKNKTWS